MGALAAALGPDAAILALIETARGVLDAAKLAVIPGVARLALGSFDLATELRIRDPVDREALLPTRAGRGSWPRPPARPARPRRRRDRRTPTTRR